MVTVFGISVLNGLPEPLVQAGWGLFWSQRESRHYFFNSLSNQSLWEMPQLPPTGVVPRSPTGAAPFVSYSVDLSFLIKCTDACC